MGNDLGGHRLYTQILLDSAATRFRGEALEPFEPSIDPFESNAWPVNPELLEDAGKLVGIMELLLGGSREHDLVYSLDLTRRERHLGPAAIGSAVKKGQDEMYAASVVASC